MIKQNTKISQLMEKEIKNNIDELTPEELKSVVGGEVVIRDNLVVGSGGLFKIDNEIDWDGKL